MGRDGSFERTKNQHLQTPSGYAGTIRKLEEQLQPLFPSWKCDMNDIYRVAVVTSDVGGGGASEGATDGGRRRFVMSTYGLRYRYSSSWMVS